VLACVLAIVIFGRPQHPAPVPLASIGHAWFNQPAADSSHYYFGGRYVRGSGIPLQLGAKTSTWASFLLFAAAPQVLAPSCLVTAPPAAAETKPPKDIADDLPGLYGAPWVASVNGNLIAALHVTVPRHPRWPPASPVLQIYRNGATQPAFSQAVPVSVTRGSNALLYRMFVNGPVACIDLVIPNGAGAGTAHIYYPFRGRMLDAVGVFTVQR
jgi:hypothetical protein